MHDRPYTAAPPRAASTTGQPWRISLALQGGGAHGAFTWGVLDRLLEEPDLEIAGVSGTSAGAVNACLLVDGLAAGGHAAARRRLRDFWRRIATVTAMSPLQPTAFDQLLGPGSLHFQPAYWMLEMSSRLFSPYHYNALDMNPVRDVLFTSVDFDRIRATDGPPLFVSATHVREGRVKIFRRPELSLDAVVASTCIPFLHKAVEVDGEAYWDGGYLGNPAVIPLYEEVDCRDILVVQVAPVAVAQLPTTAQEIFDRVTTIACNAGLLRELQVLQDRAEADGEALRLHRIHAEDSLGELEPSSKLNADWRFLSHLHDLGRVRAAAWLAEHRSAVGSHGTLEPASPYL